MPDLTDTDRRFLDRVETITVEPWTGKVSALDRKGKRMRLSKATFERLKTEGLIIRSSSSLVTDTYGPQNRQIIEATLPESGSAA